jgi:hypothetical protein
MLSVYSFVFIGRLVEWQYVLLFHCMSILLVILFCSVLSLVSIMQMCQAVLVPV